MPVIRHASPPIATSRAGLTLLEVAFALAVFTGVTLSLSSLYLSGAQMSMASEEEHRAVNALRAEIAQVRLLEADGSGSYSGLDAVIRRYLTTPDFVVPDLVAEGQPEVGQVQVLTDLDGDEQYEVLVDSDGDGEFVETSSGEALSEADSEYGCNDIQLRFTLSWRSVAGGPTQQTHTLTLTRKWR